MFACAYKGVTRERDRPKPLTWSPGVTKGKKLRYLLSQLLGSPR